MCDLSPPPSAPGPPPRWAACLWATPAWSSPVSSSAAASSRPRCKSEISARRKRSRSQSVSFLNDAPLSASPAKTLEVEIWISWTHSQWQEEDLLAASHDAPVIEDVSQLLQRGGVERREFTIERLHVYVLRCNSTWEKISHNTLNQHWVERVNEYWVWIYSLRGDFSPENWP